MAIYLFDGRPTLQTLIGFTRDHDDLTAAITSLDDYEVLDPSTNLNGAIVSGLEVLDSIAVSDPDSMVGASMVVFTDGADMAGYVTNEELEALLKQRSCASPPPLRRPHAGPWVARHA